MTSSDSERCPSCGSHALTPERLVEHDCGHVAPADEFDDGCEKCTATAPERDLTPLGTTDRCLECGHRSSSTIDEVSIPTELPSVTFPTLPSSEDHLNWVPARFVPQSQIRRQVLTTVLVILVLSTGIVGAVSVTPLLEETPTEPASVETSVAEYESIVVFRNDDIQPWYNQEELRAVNDVFIDEEVPVTLGIIPDTNGDASLTDDPELCSYLRSLESDHPGQFEMAVHGYTHEPETDFYDGSEFGDLPRDEQRERLADGEAILADCVESPSSTFIPPMNTYDETTVDVLEDADYTTVSGGSWFTNEYYDTDESVFEAGELTHVSETQAFENWSEYEDADDEDDVPFEDLETMTESFDDAHEANEIHTVMLHYQYFTTDERLDQLESLIEHMKGEDDVAFMTIEQLSIGMETGAVEETDDGWRVEEPIEHATDTVAETDGDPRDRGPIEHVSATVERVDDILHATELVEHVIAIDEGSG